MSREIHEAFAKEEVFVTSPLNYIVYESGYSAGVMAERNREKKDPLVPMPVVKTIDVKFKKVVIEKDCPECEGAGDLYHDEPGEFPYTCPDCTGDGINKELLQELKRVRRVLFGNDLGEYIMEREILKVIARAEQGMIEYAEYILNSTRRAVNEKEM